MVKKIVGEVIYEFENVEELIEFERRNTEVVFSGKKTGILMTETSEEKRKKSASEWMQFYQKRKKQLRKQGMRSEKQMNKKISLEWQKKKEREKNVI